MLWFRRLRLQRPPIRDPVLLSLECINVMVIASRGAESKGQTGTHTSIISARTLESIVGERDAST
jgi:hypothetical protein